MGFIKKTKYFLLSIANPRLFSTIYLKLTFLFLLYFLRFRFDEFLSAHIFLLNTFSILITYLTLNLLFNYSRLIIIFFYLRKNKHSSDFVDNFVLGINRISFFLNHFIFTLVLIHIFIINLRDLLTTISLIAVAFVLIFKDYIANFINGIIIMFSDEIRLKDYIKIGDFKGRVSNLTLKNIELKTENGNLVYIPNTLAFTKEVINYSKNPIKNVQFEHTLPINSYKKYDRIKTAMTSNIYENFSDIISSQSNITLKIEKIEKDFAILSFEIIVSRYTYKIEERVKNYASELLIKNL